MVIEGLWKKLKVSSLILPHQPRFDKYDQMLRLSALDTQSYQPVVLDLFACFLGRCCFRFDKLSRIIHSEG